MRVLPWLIGLLLLLALAARLLPGTAESPFGKLAGLLAIAGSAALTLWLALASARTQAALEDSEANLSRAQSIARLGSWEYDALRNRVRLSQAACALLGFPWRSHFSRAEILQRIHPDDRRALRRAWRAAMAGDEFDIGHRVVVDHQPIWLHTRAELRRDAEGRMRGAMGVFQDVTAQHLAATQLAELAEFSEKVIAESPVGIAVLDADGPLVLANEAMARLAGTTVARLQRLNFRKLKTWREHGLIEAAQRALEQQTTVTRRAIGVAGFAGRLAVECDFTPIQRQGRQHLLLIVRDVSEFEAAAASLREGRRLAEEANRAKSEFLANMSHEIRTPMNAVIGLAHLALDRAEDAQLRTYLRQLREAADGLLDIINDILDYSKIEAGQMTIAEQEFALREVTARAIGLFREGAAAKGLEFTTQIADGLPPRVLGDPVRIGQIITNLVGNAIKFTESGKVVFRIQAGRHPLAGERPVFDFEVADSGIGMDQTALANLFQPFVQGDGSISRRYGGSGLGLSISRRLAQLMGGDIEVVSQPGAGSRFTLWLPLAIADHSATTRGTASASSEATPPELPQLARRALPLRGRRILLVEDDPINQLVLTRLLQEFGIDVRSADHGAQALQRLREGPCDAVLMDLQMPVLDGFAATRAIRADQTLANLPVIAVTAGATPSYDADACRAAGLDDLLLKPVQPAALVECLLRHLAGDHSSVPIAPAMPTSPSAPRNDPHRDELEHLAQRLARNDFVSVGELVRLRASLSPLVGVRAERLEAAISRYDYAQARVILSAILASLESDSP